MFTTKPSGHMYTTFFFSPSLFSKSEVILHRKLFFLSFLFLFFFLISLCLSLCLLLYMPILYFSCFPFLSLFPFYLLVLFVCLYFYHPFFFISLIVICLSLSFLNVFSFSLFLSVFSRFHCYLSKLTHKLSHKKRLTEMV